MLGSVASSGTSSSVWGLDKNQEHVDADLRCLCSNPDFMLFFYQHVACCPPRGPFRYYSALTFVVRARERYGSSDLRSSSSSTTAASGLATPGDASLLLRAINIRSITALMEMKFQPHHLEDWPLFYLFSEVHSADIEAIQTRQQEEQKD